MDELPDDLLMVIIYHVLIGKWNKYGYCISDYNLISNLNNRSWVNVRCLEGSRIGLYVLVSNDYISVYKESQILRRINKRFKNIISKNFGTINVYQKLKIFNYKDVSTMYTRIAINFMNKNAIACSTCPIRISGYRYFLLFKCIQCKKLHVIECSDINHNHICSVCPDHIHKLVPTNLLELTKDLIDYESYDQINDYMNRLIRIYG